MSITHLNLAPGLTGDGVRRLEECDVLLPLELLLLLLLLLSGNSLIGDNLFGISRVLCYKEKTSILTPSPSIKPSNQTHSKRILPMSLITKVVLVLMMIGRITWNCT